MNGTLRFVRRPRLLLSAAAGALAALGLWLAWPVGPRAVLPAVLRCEAVFFSPDSTALATMHWKQGGDNEGAVILWDALTGQERRRLFEGRPYFKKIAFSPDGRKLAGRDSGTNWKAQVHVWDLDTGREDAVYWREEWREWSCSPIAFSRDGKLLVFDDHSDWMVEADTGRRAFELKQRHGINWSFRTTGFDDQVIYGNARNIWIVDLGTGELRAKFTHDGDLETLSSHATTLDGTVLVAGEAVIGHPHYLFSGGAGEGRRLPAADGMSWLALSPDGRWLAAGASVLHDYQRWHRWLPWATSHDHAFEVHDLSWGWRAAHFRGVTAAKFSPDGRTLALIAEDETVQLWDFPVRTPWPIVAVGGVLAAGFVYMLLAVRLVRRRSSEVNR